MGKKRLNRMRALELATAVMVGRTDEAPAPLLWSLTVFFENYMDGGARATQKDFGPRKPTKLKVVKAE
jgi:hypothetical protein